MWLQPTNDLKLVNKKERLWSVTGEDPQFLLRNSFGSRLSPGLYFVAGIGDKDLDRLRDATLYVDTGSGFNESERLPIDFGSFAGDKDLTQQRNVAVVRFDRPVRALRFDPSGNEARPTFALKGLSFRRVEQKNSSWAKRSVGETLPKVLINLVRLLPDNAGAGGAGRLCFALLRYLPEHALLRAAIPAHHARLAVTFPLVDFVIVAADDNAHLSAHLAWCDVYVDPLNALRPTAINSNVAVISLILDLQHLRLPWFFSPAEFDARIAEYGYAIGRSDRLIAISEYERRNLETFYGATDVKVVHLAGFTAEDKCLTREEISKRRSAGNEKPYLIYPAVPWPHKNHETLIQAMALLQRRGVEIPLVLTNTQGSSTGAARLTKLNALFGLEDIVTCEPFLQEDALLDRYMQACGMVFPSLYEGFGIPLVDAMSLGVPLLVNNTSAVGEICEGACATFVNARNAVAMADDIEQFWRDEDKRASLAIGGFEQAKKFSSRKMAADIGAAIIEARERKNKGINSPIFTLRAAPRYTGLSIFLVYAGLTEAERDALRAIEDIESFHASVFGSDAHVTVGFDINLAQDDAIYKLFKTASRLICVDPTRSDALDFAVQEFCARHDECACHLVTRYSHCVKTYRPEVVRAMTLGLTLYPTADYAELDNNIEDCVIDAAPSDSDGALAYDTNRRFGTTVWDALIRREILPGAQNGSVSFMSYFSTRCRRLRVPNKGE